MHADWDNAHTDYSDHSASKDRPVPAGLAESESAWQQRLDRAPNGWLLRGNAMVQALAAGHPVHLMHTTVALDAIRTSGHLLASSGCLVAALYCAPLTPEPGGGLRPHNLGTYLLDTKRHTRTLVLEVTPDRPVPPKGIDYLRLGAVHLRTYLTHRNFLTPTEDEQLRHAALARIRATGPFLDLLLANACGLRTPEAEFVDRLSAAVPQFPFLGYLYFEVLSEYLMLHSSTTETKRCAEAGELNNRLYKQLAHSAVEGMDRLFDLSRFNPRHDRLVELVEQVDPTLAPGAARYARARLAHLFAGIALHPSQDAATFSFQQRSFEELATAAPGLLGQLLFRELRVIDRYPSSTSRSNRRKPSKPGPTGTTRASLSRSTGRSRRARSASTPPTRGLVSPSGSPNAASAVSSTPSKSSTSHPIPGLPTST
ncbi:hypothetical protein [Kitasatospora sp. NPDC057015]|uniref:hypothetical protein n=1 Tax=Kitasatospora sp. NPDC057015 TaxID=3346001 RepID=UPI003634F65E